MTFHAAPHKQALKKRVNRFFKSSTQFRADVYDFVDIITEKNQFDVYVFGGLVRDIGLFGVRDFSSDIDLVVESNRPSLLKALSRLPKENVTENKYGGFRIRQGAWDIDIWCAKDTWAIKNRLVVYKDVTSLLKTTFLSWDSALFDVRNQNLICSNDYIENLVNGRLDVVLQDSQNELGSMVRLTRAIYSKGARELKSNALETLRTYFGKYSLNEIVAYEQKSYSKKFLDWVNLERLRSNVESLPRGSLLKIEFEKQLLLPLGEMENRSDTLHSQCTRSIHRIHDKLGMETSVTPINEQSQLKLRW
jgi:predicted nucleotidyltransferase